MNPINKLIVSFVKILPKPVTFIFARKYIAGLALSDAVNTTKQLNEKGILSTIDVLGEAITSKDEAIEAKEECLKVLTAIYENKIDANLSVKPTQIGLEIDADFAYDLMVEILQKASESNNFVRIDMEDSSVTRLTIDLYKRLRERYSNVGIVLQAYLHRTISDTVDLNKINANYRLCKGIYVEPEEISFKDKQEVRNKYLEGLKLILDSGCYVGIATHDEYLVNGAYKLIREKNIPNDKFEFQMLYGVTENLRDRINADGYKIRIYVPYGEKWHHYSMRRLQENPKIAWYIVKSLFTVR